MEGHGPGNSAQDVGQTDSEPLPEVAPARLKGDAPAGLWEALAGQVAADGCELRRGKCARPQANGSTGPATKNSAGPNVWSMPGRSGCPSGASGCCSSLRATARDPGGFARLRALCDADPHVSAISGSHTLYRAAEIVAAKGGGVSDITVGDVLELLEDTDTKRDASWADLCRELRVSLMSGKELERAAALGLDSGLCRRWGRSRPPPRSSFLDRCAWLPQRSPERGRHRRRTGRPPGSVVSSPRNPAGEPTG